MIRSFKEWRSIREDAIHYVFVVELQHGNVWLSATDIAKKTNATRFVTRRLLSDMERRGLVTKAQWGRTPLYKLVIDLGVPS
jgi:DNA-binding IscR family transcriptional regulator